MTQIIHSTIFFFRDLEDSNNLFFDLAENINPLEIKKKVFKGIRIGEENLFILLKQTTLSVSDAQIIT